MATIEHLRELMSKATPLPWTADFLGGRELADQGVLRDVESVSSPFCRAEHRDDEAFAVAAVNALPALLSLARAAKVESSRHADSAGDDGCPCALCAALVALG